MGILTCILLLSNYSIAIEDLESSISAIGSEEPEYENCNAEVASKKKTKQ